MSDRTARVFGKPRGEAWVVLATWKPADQAEIDRLLEAMWYVAGVTSDADGRVYLTLIDPRFNPPQEPSGDSSE